MKRNPYLGEYKLDEGNKQCFKLKEKSEDK